ncbi:nucleoside abc transporter, permease protein 1 [hydrocarbon metagenome]|uniref:Nucleoside abc transporter, permease protein 1 n=1 Tax=hydrocarbon metagenome TaxID=938273 RepID=A0A0W8E949_9ZZZZ
MPKLKLIRREKESAMARLVVPVLSIIMAFTCGWVFLAVSGYSAAVVFTKMFNGALGSPYAISETIVKAIPLMIAGLAISLAFKMKLWNIGAEGQIYMGAFAASGIALALGNGSPYILIPLMMIAGFAAGALWGLVPGILKAYWQVNETIITLMLNYIGIFWVDYLVFGPWKDPNSMGFPLTPIFSPAAQLPTWGDSRVHLGLLFAVIIAIVFYLLVQYTRWGYEVRVMGESSQAARYAGMSVSKNIILVMMISGGIAGIAGMIEVSGITHRLQQGVSPGYGYTAIIVAWLARLNPFAIILVAFLFGALIVGGFAVQMVGVSFSITQILQGMVLFFLLAGEIFLRYSLVLVREEAD